jgi:ABC-type dipeptide/oligopeptide/nickel transport system permease component
VWSYLLRRLLLLVPTMFGALVITFAIARMGQDPLRSSLSATGDEEGALDPKLIGQSIESGLTKARRTGQDLPALLNTRGFLDQADLVAWLRQLERRPDQDEADRLRSETRLWIQGRFAAAPLYAIIQDPELTELHGPASLAFSFCAYRPLLKIDLQVLAETERRRIRLRNQALRFLRIEHENDRTHGYRLTDPDPASKRLAIAEFWQRYGNDFQFSTTKRWQAVVLETGFVDFFVRFFSGQLESEQFQRPVMDLIGERWYVSFWLQMISVCLAWGIAVPLGIRSARIDGSLEDNVTTNSLFLLWSLPDFFVGSLLLFYFCTDRTGAPAWFPNRGLSSPDALWYGTPRYLLDLAWHGLLPLICLTYASFTVLSRYMRGQMLEQLHTDYARTARAKGCAEDRVVYGHCLRNSLVTMITLGSGLLTVLFGGFVIVESIFSINGLGLLLLDAARAQDVPLIMSSTIISVGLLLLSILTADLLYAVVDPRIREQFT